MQALNETRIKNYNTFSPGGQANSLTSYLGSKWLELMSYHGRMVMMLTLLDQVVITILLLWEATPTNVKNPNLL